MDLIFLWRRHSGGFDEQTRYCRTNIRLCCVPIRLASFFLWHFPLLGKGHFHRTQRSAAHSRSLRRGQVGELWKFAGCVCVSPTFLRLSLLPFCSMFGAYVSLRSFFYFTFNMFVGFQRSEKSLKLVSASPLRYRSGHFQIF